MQRLRRYVPEAAFLLLALLWVATTAEAPGPENSLGNVGISLGGLALLIRAVTPLLRPRHDSSADREDLVWQAQTTVAIEHLSKTFDAWLIEQRRHNQQMERYFAPRSES
jgi:hypothetical protein